MIKRIILIGFAIFIMASIAGAEDISAIKKQISENISSYIISNYPSKKDCLIEIKFIYADKLFKQLAEINKPFNIKLGELGTGFKPFGKVVFPFLVNYQDKSQDRIFIRADVKLFKNLIVASKTMHKGATLSNRDLKVAKKEVTFYPNKYFSNKVDLNNKQLTTSVKPGQIIYSWMIRQKPLIDRRSKIDILVKAPKVLLRTKGTALEEGYLGQEISVKRDNSHDKLKAKVISSQEVEVIL